MKQLFNICTLLFSIFVNSQQIKGEVMNSNSQKIENAEIYLNQNYIGKSDSKGLFSINISFKEHDTITIKKKGFSHQSFLLEKNNSDLKFFLEKETIMDTIVFNEKDYKKMKVDYTLNQKTNSRLSTISLYEIALKFKNDTNQRGIIGNVSVNLHKTDRNKNLTNLEISIYEIDSLTGKPGKKINVNPIIYTPKNKSRGRIVIDVHELKIPFPENGAFVGVKWLPNANNDKQVGPSIRLTTSVKERLTYGRYKDREWHVRQIPGSPNFYDNAMMGITVYYKKLKK